MFTRRSAQCNIVSPSGMVLVREQQRPMLRGPVPMLDLVLDADELLKPCFRVVEVFTTTLARSGLLSMQ